MYAVYDFFFLLPCLNLTILSVTNTSCGKKEFSCSLPSSAMLWAGSGGDYELDAWSSSVMAGRQLQELFSWLQVIAHRVLEQVLDYPPELLVGS